MTYQQIYDLKNPAAGTTIPALQKQATVAVSIVAQTILAEAQNVANHNARYRWAANALINAEAAAAAMMWALVGNGTIQSTAPSCNDSDVQYVIDVSVNTFAL